MDISPYVEHYLQESIKEEKETEKLFSELNRRVRKTASRLGPKYFLRKVYLFGSLTDRDIFHLKSDIDIAVTGLDPSDYLALWGDFEKHLKHSFDLINLKNVQHRLFEQIVKEGVIVYDSQKTQGK